MGRLVEPEEKVKIAGARLLAMETMVREVESIVDDAEHAVMYLSRVVESEEVDDPVGLAACLRFIAKGISAEGFDHLNELGTAARDLIRKEGAQ